MNNDDLPPVRLTFETATTEIQEVNEKDNDGQPRSTRPPPTIPRHRTQLFSGGSLKANLTAATDELNIRRDPVLEAVAAGAAVRKAKQQALRRHEQEQRITSLVTPASCHSTNEWTLSLRRFVTAAASTAKTVAHVTAPVLHDATQVVVASATEFVHDVQMEYNKETSNETGHNNNNNNDDDDKSASLLATPRSSNSTKGSLLAETIVTSLKQMPCPSSTSNRLSPTNQPPLPSLPDIAETIEEFDPKLNDKKGSKTTIIIPAEERESTSSAGIDIIESTTINLDITKESAAADEYLAKSEYAKYKLGLATDVDQNSSKAAIAHGDDTATEESLELLPNDKCDDDNDGVGADLAQVFAQVDSQLSLICADIMSDDIKGGKATDNEKDAVDREDSLNASQNSDTAAPEEEDLDPEEKGNAGSVDGQNTIESTSVEHSDQSVPGDESMLKTKMENEDHVIEGFLSTEAHNEEEKSSSIVTGLDRENSDGLGTMDDEAALGTPDSILQWLPNPFGSRSGKPADTHVETTIGTPSDADIAVETLSTYDNVPTAFTAATQAIRNFHANVQTLRECETNEQKEMCRIVCDDNYKAACKLVAEVGSEMDDQDFQARLIDDLRRLRELQKTFFADIPVQTWHRRGLKVELDDSSDSRGSLRDANSSEEQKSAEQVADPKSQPSVNDEVTSKDENDPVGIACVEKKDLVAGNNAFVQRCDGYDKRDHELVTTTETIVDQSHEIKSPHNLSWTQLRAVEESVARHATSHDGKESFFVDHESEKIYESVRGEKRVNDHVASKDPVATVEFAEAKRSLSSLDNPFKDKKAAITFIVSKIMGCDVEIKERQGNVTSLQSLGALDETLRESVFNRFNDENSSATSLSTPTLDGVLSQSDDIEESFELSSEDEISLFDFIPPKHTIMTTESGQQLARGPKADDCRKQSFVKQFSYGSFNDSLGSVSTRQKSVGSRSLSASPRRRGRRLRRRGDSKGSIRSLIPTTPIRSPYYSPVEERSLNDGRPTELTISDRGGELVGWDRETNAYYSLNVPDCEEMTEGLVDRTGLLDEGLMTFSSLEDVDFLLKNPLRAKRNPRYKDTGFLLWRQLLANFKHGEVWKDLLANSTSIAYEYNTQFEEDEDSSAATVRSVLCRLAPNDVELRCRFTSELEPTKYDGFSPLAQYLCDLGPSPTLFHGESKEKNMQSVEPLRHKLPNGEDERKVDDNIDANDLRIAEILRREAQILQQKLARIVSYVGHFASQNCASSANFLDLSWSISVKDRDAIQEKAKRKYDGDILAVKDILRGQITFPDEGTLICGLHALQLISKGERKPSLWNDLPKFEIIRMKNLFRASSIGKGYFEALPTGYRHILLNIRFDNGFVAELQFQLAQLFGILGNDGYALHKDIVLFQHGKQSETVVRIRACEQLSPDAAGVKAPGSDIYLKTANTFIHNLLQPHLPLQKEHVPASLGEEGMEASNNVIESTAASLPAASDIKDSTASDPVHGIPPPLAAGGGGGIAAMAAQAALKKAQAKTTEEDNPPPLAAGGGGGIAAMAAQAALKKAQAKTTEEDNPPPLAAGGGGGIAAMAAQAALKKAQAKTTEEDNPPPLAAGGGGGIAAMAAQAALKKAQAKTTEEDNPPPLAAGGGGGIAAMAAQAALKKAQAKTTEEDNPPPLAAGGGGGIAAMAAQAALKKAQAKTTEEDNPPPLAAGGGGGIAAMAAQAALKKAQAKTTEEDNPPPLAAGGGGGIAAMAAQAALKKAQAKTTEEDNPPPLAAGGGGGIAAMAAQAALKKAQAKTTEEDNPTPLAAGGGGGIAAMAAQAALKKAQAKTTEEDNPPPLAAGGGGGIAAMAAQAALKKALSSDSWIGVVPHQLNYNFEKPSTVNWSNNNVTTQDIVSVSSDLSLIHSIFEAGITAAISNPRDLPTFYCVYLLSNHIQMLLNGKSTSVNEGILREMSCFSRKLLLRSLSISNQATSVGMVGWLEYGTSNMLERSLRLPFEILWQLSCNLASIGDWDGAVSVLSSLVVRCKEDLSHCHPTTLAVMLDLAGALSKSRNTQDASSITSMVSNLLSSFLGEQEQLFFDQRRFEAETTLDTENVVYFDNTVDALTTMHAFAMDLQNTLTRSFLRVLGPEDHITLLNHSLVADAITVVANCLASSERQKNPSESIGGARYFWLLAYSHYEIAFKGWVRILSLSNPFPASTVCSIARCLQEIDKMDQAIAILETLASCLEKKIDIDKENNHSERDEEADTAEFVLEAEVNWQEEQIRVNCLWTLAVMTARRSPDERGRQRAFSLLHTASLALQRTLRSQDLDDETRKACLALYYTVEDEALALFEPLQQLSIPEAPKPAPVDAPVRTKKASWEVTTPMREKRQEWTSPRKKRLAMGAAENKQDANAFVQLV
ncbi:hypothetical protein IV203_013437 [Nitzschia inconspicua]|uniref:Uncharacterized protein n=1 Tax=Nitzschia inconspicua TaxID=303405 RepID=A0A9K3M5B2_9STRA|nr:hypothetical protein IV203_013437 [Nitzschia inconspicua]